MSAAAEDPTGDAPGIKPPEDIPPVSAEQLVHGEVVEDERRYPSTIGGAFYIVMLAAGAVAMAVVVLGDWRHGIRILGGALWFGAACRLALRSRDAGMLAVRFKWLDALWLTGLGTALLVLAATIPEQPGP